MNIKKTIKIFILPSLISLLNGIGIRYETLTNVPFFTESVLISQAKKLGRISIKPTKQSQLIYVLLMLPGSKYHLFIESLLALGLKQKGHSVIFIIDDNSLPIHELKRINEENEWDINAKIDYNYGKTFLNKMGLEYIAISQFLKGWKTSVYDKKHDTILDATLLKQYKVGMITKDLPRLSEKTRLIKDAIMISHNIGEKLVTLKPDSVIMSHGIYSTWGPLFNVLNDNQIPTLVHGRGKKRFSQVFNWNKTGDSWDVSDEWEKVKENPLNEAEIILIDEYLKSRVSHKNDVFVFNFGEETKSEETIKFLGLDPNKPIYSLFTNVLWDAASAQREIAFSNPVEWVIETIDWFNKHPEKQLIVKIHPAEVVIGTNMPFYDLILQHIQPNMNIRIIKPDEKINSWSVYEISSLGLVHTTTAGMEMPLVNKPCIVVSKTHYRDKGFTIDVNSKEEYFSILENFNNLKIDVKTNRTKALQYAYLLFMRYQIPFNMFFEETSTNITGFRFNSLDEYYSKSNLSEIINSIELKNNIFNNQV